MDSKDLVAIGEVVTSHGRRGEVVVMPHGDSPAVRFQDLRRVFLETSEGMERLRKLYELESVRVHKGRPLLKLEGVEGIDEARELSGGQVLVPEREIRPLPEGDYYHFQIIGLSVLATDGRELGIVEKVLTTGGADVLVVRDTRGGELLVPLCREICPVVDVQGGRIIVEVPEGLEGLNAH